MLFIETVEEPTLELLNNIMQDAEFNDFILVGGTTLALQLGHRISFDIDLFSVNPFDQDKLADHLRENYNFILDFISSNTLKGEIDRVQFDCISHRYPWLEENIITGNIRMANMIDIAAMKLNAIAGSGTRLKDFVDIAYLSAKFSLNQMLQAYGKKYNSNPVMPLKALVYFDDIMFDQPIKMAGDKSYDWNLIEQRLQMMHKNPDKVLGEI